MINKTKKIQSQFNMKHGYEVEIEEIENKFGDNKYEARVRHIKLLEDDGFEHIKYFSEITNATKSGLIQYLTKTANDAIDNYDKELFLEQYLIKSQFEDLVAEEE